MTFDPTTKAWFSTAEAVIYTGYSQATLERAVAAGELPFSQRKTGGPRRFHRTDLDAFVRGEPVAPAAVGA